MLNSLDLLIPETVIFENGTAALILYCYRENRVKYTTNENKLKPHEIMKIFTQTVRERKKIEKSRTDEIYKFTSLNAHQDSGNGKEIALLRYNGPLKTLRVMREPEFLNLIYERAGSNTWKNIDYLQTVLKSKAGIGDSVFVKYNQTDIDKSQVCLDKCMTLINSLKQKGIDISQMKAEFQLDDDGKYWFCHATGIKANKPVPLPKINKLRGLRMRPESREKLMYTLDAHMKKSKTTKHKEYESMMDACFENVKDKTGCNKTIDYKMLFDIPSRELPFRAPEYDRKPNQTSREIDP